MSHRHEGRCGSCGENLGALVKDYEGVADELRAKWEHAEDRAAHHARFAEEFRSRAERAERALAEVQVNAEAAGHFPLSPPVAQMVQSILHTCDLYHNDDAPPRSLKPRS